MEIADSLNLGKNTRKNAATQQEIRAKSPGAAPRARLRDHRARLRESDRTSG